MIDRFLRARHWDNKTGSEAVYVSIRTREVPVLAAQIPGGVREKKRAAGYNISRPLDISILKLRAGI